MLPPCDLEVQVNGGQTFFLSKDVLLCRCGRLMREYKKSLKAERGRKLDTSSLMVRMFLHELPGGSAAFENIVRFCYKPNLLHIDLKNVAVLRCAADYLEMTEDFGSGNLIKRTEAFLCTMAMWTSTSVISLLMSCENFFPAAEKAGVVQRCVDALSARANPNSYSASPNNNETSSLRQCTSPNRASNTNVIYHNCGSIESPHLNHGNIGSPSFNHVFDRNVQRSVNSSSPNVVPKWTLLAEDLCSLSPYIIERIVQNMMTQCVDHRHIAKILLRYMEGSLPLVALSSLNIGSDDDNGLVECSQRAQKEVVDVVVTLLYNLEWSSVPLKSLFELRRVCVATSATSSCKSLLEEMIGSQLHKASLDNILIPRSGSRDRKSCLYDVDLVLRLVQLFLHISALKRQTSQGTTSSGHASDLEIDRNYSNEQALQCHEQLKKVGNLLDMYLAEIAPDPSLKASKFIEVAETLPCSARDTHDGLYRAVDIYLQAHPRTTFENTMQLCRVMDFDKLSFEARKHVMENPRIPARFTFHVLAIEQQKLRAVLESGVHSSTRTSAEDCCGYPVSDIQYASIVRQNEELRSDLKNMQAKVLQLERLCKGLRSQISEEVRLGC